MVQPAPASPLFWRMNPEVYQLVGVKCKSCGHITYPRYKICPACGSFELEEYRLGRRGTVHTFCVNWTPPPGLEAPIVPVVVDLEGGGKYQGLITEVAKPEEIKIGSQVEMVLRKITEHRGLNIYGYVFRLVEEG
ncbi:Zn-ribbon domain-containing OB-fold protein [Chloroflexota bacterium]